MSNILAVLTEEQKSEILNDYKEVRDEMRDIAEHFQKKLGRNDSLTQKIVTMYETFDSFDEEEIIKAHNVYQEMEG